MTSSYILFSDVDGMKSDLAGIYNCAEGYPQWDCANYKLQDCKGYFNACKNKRSG